MTNTQADLWKRIEAFPIDQPNASRPFSLRLAEKNQWSSAFTREAILEYKKFLYLCTVEKSPMTPSKLVDEVWHFHLTYTRSYWIYLCQDTLGKSIHHEPADGSPADYDKHQAAYSNTLLRYSEHFGATAPSQIWPSKVSPPLKKRIRLTPATALLRLGASALTFVTQPTLPTALQLADFGSAIPFIIVAVVILAILAGIGGGGKGGGRGGRGRRGGSSSVHDDSCSSDCGSSCGSSCGGGGD
jgi:hypothetical protein